MVYHLSGNSSLLNELHIRSNPSPKLWISVSEGFDGLKSAVATISMFGDKTIVIKDLDNWKKQQRQQALELILGEGKNRTIFVVSSREKLKGAEQVTFEQPKPWNSKAWVAHVRNIAYQMGLKVSDEAVNNLIGMCGRNEYVLFNELGKLSSVSSSIDSELVSRYCAFHHVPRLDEVSYLVAAGRPERALDGLGKDYTDDAFPVLCSVLTGLLHDIGIISETFGDHTRRLSWQDVQEVSRKTGVGIARVARITGFSFSSGESNKCLLDGLGANYLRDIIDSLQAIDEDYKFGRINGFIAFLRVTQLFEQ